MDGGRGREKTILTIYFSDSYHCFIFRKNEWTWTFLIYLYIFSCFRWQYTNVFFKRFRNLVCRLYLHVYICPIPCIFISWHHLVIVNLSMSSFLRSIVIYWYSWRVPSYAVSKHLVFSIICSLHFLLSHSYVNFLLSHSFVGPLVLGVLPPSAPIIYWAHLK